MTMTPSWRDRRFFYQHIRDCISLNRRCAAAAAAASKISDEDSLSSSPSSSLPPPGSSSSSATVTTILPPPLLKSIDGHVQAVDDFVRAQHADSPVSIFTARRAVTRLAPCPTESSVVAIASADKSVSLLDLRTRESISLGSHEKGVSDASWSESGALLVTCAIDGGIFVWDARKRSLLRKLHGSAQCYGALFYPLNNNVLVAATQHGLSWFNLSTGKELCALPLTHAAVRALAWVTHLDHYALACACADGHIRFAVTATGSEGAAFASSWSWLEQTLRLSSRPLASLCVARDSSLVAVTAMDATFHLLARDRPTSLSFSTLGVFPVLIRSFTVRASLHQDEGSTTKVLVGGEDGRACQFGRDTATGKFAIEAEWQVSAEPVLDLFLNPTGALLVTADAKGTVLLSTAPGRSSSKT